MVLITTLCLYKCLTNCFDVSQNNHERIDSQLTELTLDATQGMRLIAATGQEVRVLDKFRAFHEKTKD